MRPAPARRPRLARDRRVDPFSEKGQYLADLFGGKAGVSRASKYLRVPAHVYEIERGPEFDLCNRENLRRLCRDARARRLIAAMIATPCTSWSQARNRTNVIRSRLEPWGVRFPGKPLSTRDRESLRLGNATMRATLVLIKCFEECKVPWCLENPASSNMWHVPQLKKLLKEKHIRLVEIDQCSFGQPWRKRTKLLFSRCDPQDLESFEQRHKCHGRRRCDFSGREHLQLTGSGPDGKPLTRKAQTFPSKMCRALARFLLADHINQRATRL